MSLQPHELELLAPAKNIEIAQQAIVHGADAVYIGGPQFGARHSASNSIQDIAKLTVFAHRYHARVFATINTILHDAELEPARQLIHQLYDAGVDALIVQDMGILEMDIPPIEMHASTQCDIRHVDKAKFLADSGFSQLVLPRELTIEQIRQFHSQVDATLEYFVHGALCVAFSGQCYISHAETGRSANRGDCSQACRLPYTLKDDSGAVVAFDKHLLSMKDNNQSANLSALVDAGVRSFKIEGRYKDMGYVKNITAHYRKLLDELIEQRGEFTRASSGTTAHFFVPNPDRNFHRGSTDYFATGRKEDIGAFDSPKFTGLPVGEVINVGADYLDIAALEPLHNGDGLSYQHKRQSHGFLVNRVQDIQLGDTASLAYRVFPKNPIAELSGLRKGLQLGRNRDHLWEQTLNKESARRTVGVWMALKDNGDQLELTLTDEDGVSVAVSQAFQAVRANDPSQVEAAASRQLGKLGNTLFHLLGVGVNLTEPWYLPAGLLNGLRRQAVQAQEQARVKAWVRPVRKPQSDPPPVYPEDTLSFLANVYNEKARAFYSRAGVRLIDAAYEAHEEPGDVPVMITKHCLRFSFNLCPKQAKGVQGVQGQVRAQPMKLVSEGHEYTLKFDCKPCEMHIIGRMRKNILKSDPPSVFPIQFHKKA
ncbi:MAG: U32 family peptidase [Limnobacter sp.]|nr:U32 family peptidase [Limnobacter sp.]